MDDEASEPSPWASDGIPVSANPSAVVWDPPPEAASPNAGIESPHSDADRDDQRPTRTIAISAIAVVALLVLGFLVWPRDQNKPVADPVVPEVVDEPSTTLGTLPDANDPGRDPATILDDVTDTPGEAGDPAENDVTGDDGDTLEIIELPMELASMTVPTELIAQSIDGRVHTVSLPSGRVRTVDLGIDRVERQFNGVNIIASPDAAMIASYDMDPIIIPRSGVPFTVDRDDFGDNTDQITPYAWLTDQSGDTMFVVAVYDYTDDAQQSYLVTSNGETISQSNATLSNFAFPTSAQGVQIVNDSGGAYRLEADGTAERIAEGTVIASSRTQVLVRECDAARVCQTVIRDIDGSNERVVALPDSLGSRFFGLSLSPDGTAVSYAVYGQQPRRAIVDFDGNELESDANNDVNPAGAWAADGSGEFSIAASEGVAFLDRASGQTIEFAAELGLISTLTARHPESELVDTLLDINPVGFAPAPPAGVVGLELVTIGRVGGLTLLDLDNATATSWTTPSIPGNAPPRLIADGDELLAAAGAGNAGFLAGFGTSVELAEGAVPNGSVAPGPSGIGIWSRDAEGTQEIDQRLVDLVGDTLDEAQQRRLTVDNATLLGDDGVGSLIFEHGGAFYSSQGAGTTQLTTGELMAVGAAQALIRECDARLVCVTSILDRATGDRITAPTEGAVLITAHGIDDARRVSLAGSMSPDSGVALLSLHVPGNDHDDDQWAFVDLTTSDVVPITTPTDGQPIIWNQDSTYAAFVSAGDVWLYERSSQSIIELTQTPTARSVVEVGPEFRQSSDAAASE